MADGLQLSQFQNSVMGYKLLDKTTAQIHFFTTGSVNELANDIRYFIKELKHMGVKTVYDSRPAPVTTQVMKEEGAKILPSDNPKYKFKATL
jgi:hypothetical protein